MFIFKQKITDANTPNFTIYLTAEERLKTQQRIEIPNFEPIYLRLPRGTILADGDLLLSESRDKIIAIAAKPESVMTATASNPLNLLKAAYHLGNRHIPLEINVNYLRFSPDSVVASLLTNLGLKVKLETTPFYPETGAYSH